MDHKIIVRQPQDDNIGSSINKLLDVLHQLESVLPGESIVIDISRISFVTHSIISVTS